MVSCGRNLDIYDCYGNFTKSILRKFKIDQTNICSNISNVLIRIEDLDELTRVILLEFDKTREIFNVSIPCSVCGIINPKIKYYLHDRSCVFVTPYKDLGRMITCEKCTFGTSEFDIRYALLSSDEYKEIPNTQKKYQNTVRKMINKLNISKCNECGCSLINSAKCTSVKCRIIKKQQKYSEIIGIHFRDILIIMIQNGYFKEAADIFQSIVRDISYDVCEEILEYAEKHDEYYYTTLSDIYKLKENNPIFKRCYPKHFLRINHENLELYTYDQYAICNYPLSILKTEDLQKIIDGVFSYSIDVYDHGIRTITELLHIQFCSIEYYQYVASNWLKYESETRQLVASLILRNTYQTTSRKKLRKYKKNCPTNLQWSEIFKTNIDTQYKKICDNIEILSNILEDVTVLNRIYTEQTIENTFYLILDKSRNIKKTVVNCSFMDFDDSFANFDITDYVITYIEIIDMFAQTHKYVDVISQTVVKLLPFEERKKRGVFTRKLTKEERRKLTYLQSQLWFVDWLKTDLKEHARIGGRTICLPNIEPTYVWEELRLSDDHRYFYYARPPHRDYFEDLIQ